jgi:HK97 family phage prohead protease
MYQRRTSERLQTREENGKRYVEGYCLVYNSVWEVDRYLSEVIMPGAAKEAVTADVRALVNHDTTFVLGRTTPGTLTLKEDNHGLYAVVEINDNDQAAKDLAARVERGDVDGWSIGFDRWKTEYEQQPDGSLRRIIKWLNIREVSVCTFPAYTATNASVRGEVPGWDNEANELWKKTIKEKLSC